jgi:hypothetical protein
VLPLIINNIGHVNNLIIVMTLQAAQIKIIIEQFVLLVQNSILNGLDFLVLPLQ